MTMRCLKFCWAAALAGVAAARAQPPPSAGGRPPPPPPWETRLSLRSESPAEPRSDGDGRIAVTDAGFGVSRTATLDRGFVRFSAAYHRATLEESGDNAAATWTGIAGEYDRFGVSAFYLRPGRWTWTALAGVETAHRAGVSLEEGLSGLTLIAAQTRVAEGLSLGAGLLAGWRLEDDPLIIPVPVLEYRWGREWTLALDRGLSLRHRPGNGSGQYFLEAAWDTHRYRLPDSEAAAPGGVLAHRQVTAHVGWEGELYRRLTTRWFVGSAVWQEFALKDSDGDTVRRVRTEPAFSAGVQFRYAF